MLSTNLSTSLWGNQSQQKSTQGIFGNNTSGTLSNFNQSNTLFNQGMQTPQKNQGNFNSGFINQGTQIQMPMQIPIPNGTYGYKFAPRVMQENKDNITMMTLCLENQFMQYSFEELKLIDLELKKKGMVNNQAQQGNAFGFNNQTNTNTITTNSLFGNNSVNANNQSGFFGNQSQSTLFGQNQQQQQQQPQQGLFGNTTFNNSAQSSGLFGANANTNTTGNSLFGGSNTGGNLFGINNNNNTTGSSGLFGNLTNNTGNNLFSNGGTSSLFGNTNTANNNNTNLFNQNQSTQSSSLFGNNQQQNNTGTLFGNTNNTNTNSNPFTQFTAQNNQQQSLFNNLQGNAVSLFSNNQQQQQQQPQQQQQSSLFSSSTPSLFNSIQPQNNTTSSNNNLFNSTTSTTSLFGNQNNNQQNTNSLFGNNNSSSSLFNLQPQTTTTPQTSLFGNSTSTTGSNSLFSSTPATTTNSLFGTLSSSLTQSSNQNQQAQAQVQPQIASQCYYKSIDYTELPQEIIDALNDHKDINDIKRVLEEKYEREIKGSLLFNKLSANERRYGNEEDYFASDGIDYAKEYYKARHYYLRQYEPKKETKIKLKPMTYSSTRNNKVNNTSALSLSVMASSCASFLVESNSKPQAKDKAKDQCLSSVSQSQCLGLKFDDSTKKVIVKIKNKPYAFPLPDPSTSISTFKQLIQGRFSDHIPLSDISLLYKNVFLLEHKTIRDYNINESSLIEVIINHITHPSDKNGSNGHHEAEINIDSDVNSNEVIDTNTIRSKSDNEHVAKIEDIPKISITKFQINPGYKEICRMSNEELRLVRNFSIENEYGKIRFLAEVDLLRLNIDDIITIEPLKVKIYDNKTKPPKGKELNVSKEITINQLYISKEEEKELKATITRGGAVFQSYDKATGVLVFREE